MFFFPKSKFNKKSKKTSLVNFSKVTINQTENLIQKRKTNNEIKENYYSYEFWNKCDSIRIKMSAFWLFQK